LLTSFIIGYELHCRLGDLVHPPAFGFHFTTTGLYVVPVIAGKLLGLDEEKLVNAIGLSGCFGFTLEEVHYGALSMARTIAYPLAAQHGISCAFLAQNGFTGQRRIFEGEAGMMRQFSLKLSDVEHLTKIGESWQVRPETINLRKIASNNVSQSPVTATLECVIENDIAADNVKSVKALISQHSMKTAADPERRHPRTKESSDHSTYYQIAVAIADRDVSPAQYTAAKVADPKIHALIDKISIEVDPDLPKGEFPFPKPTRWPATVIIETKDGKTYTKHIEKPKGYFGNLMTDAELSEKFRKMNRFSKVFSEERADEIIKTILTLEELDDINTLTKLLGTRKMKL
jgi:2-methylcitrate dehydratase